MDPKATLRLILEAIRDGDRREATTALQNLLNWLEMGGFLPSADDLATLCASFVKPE